MPQAGIPFPFGICRDVKALLAAHSIPLVIDGTRVVENAQFLIEQEKEHAGKSLWAVAREILSCADVVIGSLTKDFCVNKGGLIATNDDKLFQRLQELVCEEGGGIDLIDRKLHRAFITESKADRGLGVAQNGRRPPDLAGAASSARFQSRSPPAATRSDRRQADSGVQGFQVSGRVIPGLDVFEHRDSRERAQRGNAKADPHQ